MISFEYEVPYWEKGTTIIAIDEVGRGCLAGPLTLGATCFRPLTPQEQSLWLLKGIDDSKKLSAKKRLLVYKDIQKSLKSYYTESVSVPTINTVGIMNAWRIAAAKLLHKCHTDFPNDTFTLLVDGLEVDNIPYTEDIVIVPIVKGDTKSITIAAASIVAKVTRDTFMEKISMNFPMYCWEKNKGYGTLVHRQAIQKYGVSPWHRTLFVRSIISKQV